MKSQVFSLLLIASLTFGAEAGLACTCAPPKSPARELERSTAVFSGKVLEVKRHKRTGDIFGGVEAVFRVERAWKGVESRTVSVFTSAQSAACGYGFKEGSSYLVYAHGNAESKLSTSICSRTRRLKDAREDLDELGAGGAIAEGVLEELERGASCSEHNTGTRPAPRRGVSHEG